MICLAAELASPGNLLEMQVPGPDPRPTESERWSPAICVLIKHLDDSGTC